MKACVLEAVGQLIYQDVPDPIPKENEVLLEVKACGICSSDIDRIFKTGTYHFPTIPGHEFSGKIIGFGKGVDPELLGKRAAVFPLLPCFGCPSCAAGAYARCLSYNYFGSRCDGGFAERICVPVWNLVFFPDSLSYHVAALCEPTAVAVHAVRAAEIRPGENIAVIGNGTIGLLSAILAKRISLNEPIIIGRNKQKLRFAEMLGLEKRIDSSQEDPVKLIRRMTRDEGADVVLEMAGTSQSISMALDCVKKGGRVILTGNPTQDILLPRDTYWKILRGELTLKGTWNSSFNDIKNDWLTALEFLSENSDNVKQLITHRFSLDQADQAFDILIRRKRAALKIMFVQ